MNIAFKDYNKLSSLANCIRNLSADAIEHAESGHPGMVLGFADVMTALVFNFLKFIPQSPKWLARDRLVLSAGHGSMLLYSFYYLTGYNGFSLDDLKNFRNFGSKASGHPEYEAFEAIETSTGPLGQGLANAVGMAIAGKKRLSNHALLDYKIYCIVGDGCLMEGISYEAASLAGHLVLNNLIILFDDNQISIDGETTLTVSENQFEKFKALGFTVESIDGHDQVQINAALLRAQGAVKPYFISCRTIIGKGCNVKANSASAHGSSLGSDEVKYLKEQIGFGSEPFYIPDSLLKLWQEAALRNYAAYEYFKLNYQISAYENDIDQTIIDILKAQTATDEATRTSFGRIIEALAKDDDNIIYGSADLASSTNIKNNRSNIISKDNFSGNFIHYGVREHAMAGIMNGLSLSGFIPIGSSFFVFSDYMRPSIRLAAIMALQVIYIMTHDSIGVGEDGPTHQPVEHLASFRAMPNLLVMRPANYLETLECYLIALVHKTGPSMLVLSRQILEQGLVRPNLNENLSKRGAYFVINKIKPIVLIFASGSELTLAIKISSILEQNDITASVVSVPSFEQFYAQDKNYQDLLLRNSALKIGIEAGTSFGWHKIIGDNGLFFGVEQYGGSGTADQLYKHFKLTKEHIVKEIMNKLSATT